jgi:LysM repeat protein
MIVECSCIPCVKQKAGSVQRYSYLQGKFTRTAALMFFIMLLIADGIVSFYYVRDQLSFFKLGWYRTYLPIIQRSGEPAPEATSIPVETAIPPSATPEPAQKTYTVQAGDTLFKIAQANGITVDELAQANQITNVDLIKVGQVLVIPPASRASATPEPSPSATTASSITATTVSSPSATTAP